jgi:hypothetical protein
MEFREQPKTAVMKAERFRAQFDGATENLRSEIERSRPLFLSHLTPEQEIEVSINLPGWTFGHCVVLLDSFS